MPLLHFFNCLSDRHIVLETCDFGIWTILTGINLDFDIARLHRRRWVLHLLWRRDKAHVELHICVDHLHLLLELGHIEATRCLHDRRGLQGEH